MQPSDQPHTLSQDIVVSMLLYMCAGVFPKPNISGRRAAVGTRKEKLGDEEKVHRQPGMLILLLVQQAFFDF